MFMFASYGVQLFGGKLARCNDPTITRRVRHHVDLFISLLCCTENAEKALIIVFYRETLKVHAADGFCIDQAE